MLLMKFKKVLKVKKELCYFLIQLIMPVNNLDLILPKSLLWLNLHFCV